MKTTLGLMLASLVGCASSRANVAENAPIGPDFASQAPRLHIDKSLVASGAMNRIEPADIVAFKLDSDTLTEGGVAQVDTTARWMSLHPAFKLVLEGHTDMLGTQLFNEDLATKRMNTVRTRLIAHGINADRIVMITYGEREAITPENPNDRRVEMFATRQAPQTVIAAQLEGRNVIVATWTDRNKLMTLQPGGSPPVQRTARR